MIDIYRNIHFWGICFTVLATAIPAQAQSLSGKVVSIGDGDTLKVNTATSSLTVRLACIDAPEMAQAPYGAASREKLQQLLPIGQNVTLQVVDRDRYGRTVAKVYKGNTSVNLALVQQGYAVVYQQYLKGCPELERELVSAEGFAKLQRIGFWNQASPILPWDFRRDVKPIARNTSSKNTFQGMPACINSDCNCSDFKTHAEAQRVFNAYPGDPFGLDRDKDGLACEALP